MAMMRSHGRVLMSRHDREYVSTARISIGSIAVTVAILSWAIAKAYLAS